MRALRRFTVRPALPGPLAVLDELGRNLRWSWHAPTRDLFARIDPGLWRDAGGDPLRLLSEVSATRLEQLAGDPAFLDAMHEVHQDLTGYLAGARWYQTLGDDVPARIAYFSPEFGITTVLPQYSGGLGILAGDHLKTASDLAVPLVGVGLLYRSGYFTQSFTHDGWQQEHYPSLEPRDLPLTPLHDDAGEPLRVGVDLPEGRTLWARVWRADVGRVPLLLLDSDTEPNAPSERSVTDRLYGGGVEHRLLQEVLLGIGGVRALRAWAAATGEPVPEVYHTNEGHAGFLGLERIAELMTAGKLDFPAAQQAVRAGTVFTTHTPVPAGIDRFPRELVAQVLKAACPVLPTDEVLELGAESDPSVFNMAHMGLRLAQRCNGVSSLHGEVSRRMFGSLWPGFDVDEVPVTSVTNGVHALTWLGRPALDALVRRGVDPVATPSRDTFAVFDELSDAELWEARCRMRGEMITEARRRLRAARGARGATDAELGWVDGALDPDVLTLGFARRVPSYKRLTLLLTDPERLKRLLLDPERPVQLVIAGKAHPADDGGKELIQQMLRFADDPTVRHRIVFLPDYDMALARHLVSGCDVWLNTPLRPFEACGTSGMKAALNGGLNLSVRDGWWDEMDDGGNGWTIPTAAAVPDPVHRDELEADALYQLVETSVVPLFYDGRDAAGVPTRWIAMVRRSVASLGPRVLSSRMLREYVERLYLPAARASRAMALDGYHAARAFAAWQARVATAWPSVRIGDVTASGPDDLPRRGARLHLTAEVQLGELSPDDVEVEACAGRTAPGEDTLRDVVRHAMRPCGEDEGSYRFEADVPLEHAGGFGYTVRVVPRHDLLTGPAELGLVRYSD